MEKNVSQAPQHLWTAYSHRQFASLTLAPAVA